MVLYVALEKSDSIPILNPLYYQFSFFRGLSNNLFALIVMNFVDGVL